MRMSGGPTRGGHTAQRDGFTLVEVVVAIVVLSIGLLSSASVVGSVIQRQMRSTSRIEMITVADSKLEHLRVIAATPSADTVQLNVGGSITAPTSNYSEVFTTPAGKRYRTQWAVAQGPVGTRTVSLRVVPLPRTRGDMTSMDFTATFLLLTR